VGERGKGDGIKFLEWFEHSSMYGRKKAWS
jgi:hypothetical protein